ncbi:flagellar hook-associated protein FlgL [Clostridium beijerinckii]|uniref:flagellar hook-associated protein FlgL n=1 Tax=Clostridium beijerinckii TaxID=1520 RepID=UPI00156DB652|nr:flagellar hook-associated protein FlgL [Clostridium beijerinckii]NRT73726.1 flagellar hook-associated protein 3 FlgL [Clostridium beijerinckii]
MSRITNKMISNNYLSDMQTNLKSMSKIQNQLSSGKTINRGSDNPTVAARIMQLNTEISSNKQYNSNITDTSNWLDTTDTALSEAGNVLSRIRELMVKAGNGAYDSDEIKSIKTEVVGDIKQLTQVFNTSFDGSYIFGGTKSTSKPLTVDDNGSISYGDKDGEALSYKITSNATSAFPADTVINDSKSVNDRIADLNNNVLNTDPANKDALDEMTKLNSMLESFKQIGSDLKSEISEGVSVTYNKTATNILEFHDNGMNKDIDAKDTLSKIVSDLSKAAKENSEDDATSQSALSDINGDDLKQLDAIISNLLQTRSSVGTLQNRMESATSTNEDQNYNMTSILSSSGDIDFTEKTVEYSSVQTVYTAALQTSSKVLQKTLLDYI